MSSRTGAFHFKADDQIPQQTPHCLCHSSVVVISLDGGAREEKFGVQSSVCCTPLKNYQII
jgi:hypothetical protein